MNQTHDLNHCNTTEELAKWYDQKYSEMGGGWDCPRSEALKYIEFMQLSNDKSKSLLDVGCGQGHFTAIANEFVNAIGWDISKVIVDKASQTYPGLTFVVRDIEEGIEVVIGTFDYVTSIGSIEHCVDISKALQSIHQVLKDDGRFYALVPNEEWQHFDQANEQTFTDDEWWELFHLAGFKVIKKLRTQDISHFLLEKEHHEHTI